MQAHENSRGKGLPLGKALRLCSVPLLVAAISACATTKELPPSEATVVAPVEAMIVPPPGGPGIVTVVSTTFPNAVQQEISLVTQARTAGENKITILQFVGEGGDGSDARVRDIPFTNVNLTLEALTAWPGTGMAVSPYYVQNQYGPFGYAIGRPSNGDTCIYAWQRIAPSLNPSGSVKRGAINVRLQLCKRNSSEEELLEVMYKLRLKGNVHTPLSAPAAIGRIAAPIRPVGAQGFAEVIPIARPAAPAPAAQPAPRPTPVVTAPVAIVPPPGAPIVPSPTGTGTRIGTGGSGPLVPPPPSGGVVVPPPPSGGQ